MVLCVTPGAMVEVVLENTVCVSETKLDCVSVPLSVAMAAQGKSPIAMTRTSSRDKSRFGIALFMVSFSYLQYLHKSHRKESYIKQLQIFSDDGS